MSTQVVSSQHWTNFQNPYCHEYPSYGWIYMFWSVAEFSLFRNRLDGCGAAGLFQNSIYTVCTLRLSGIAKITIAKAPPIDFDLFWLLLFWSFA